MKPIVYRLRDQYGDRIDFHFLDAAEPRWMALIRKLAAHHPVVLAINLPRGIVEQRVGFQDEAALTQMLDTVVE